MIKVIRIYAACCDICKSRFKSKDDKVVTSVEHEGVILALKEQDEWHRIEDTSKVLCPACHTTKWNDVEDELHAYTVERHPRDARLIGKVI